MKDNYRLKKNEPFLKPDDFFHTLVNLGPTEAQGDFVHKDKESLAELSQITATEFKTLL